MRKVWESLREPRRITVPCTVEIERSFDSLHAHAIPEGVTLRPGDRVNLETDVLARYAERLALMPAAPAASPSAAPAEEVRP